ncbi:MAG: hypothetical protein SCH71_07335 [Desulfobulbaceae bacterium]|nr:hypothetical protein [Desulfobulbaceae bacterium]
MKKLCSCFVLFLVFSAVMITAQLSTATDAGAVVTGSTSMTVVTVRKWITKNNEEPVFWSEKFGLHSYRISGKAQYWKNDPLPIPFTRDYNGNVGGLIWAIYDDAGTGNKSFVANAWDFVGPYSEYKAHGGGVNVSDGWQGLMLSTICSDKNYNGKHRSNIIFTQK